MPTTDNFCVEIIRELWLVIGEPLDAEIATKERGREVDVLVKEWCQLGNNSRAM